MAMQQMQYAPAPGSLMATASKVPMQQMYAAQPMQAPYGAQAAPSQQPPEPPKRLTDGFPDPSAVEQQKAAYAKSLENQLKTQSEEVAKRSQAEKDALLKQAAQSKAAFNLQIETALQQQARALDEQTNAQMLALQEAAVQQKSTLEGQAAGLKLEFEQKKAQEDMMIRQYEIQKQYYEAQVKLQSQMQQVMPEAGQMQQVLQMQQAQGQPGMQQMMMQPGTQPMMMQMAPQGQFPPGMMMQSPMPSQAAVPQMMLQQPTLVQSVPAQTLMSMAAPGGAPPVGAQYATVLPTPTQ